MFLPFAIRCALATDRCVDGRWRGRRAGACGAGTHAVSQLAVIGAGTIIHEVFGITAAA